MLGTIQRISNSTGTGLCIRCRPYPEMCYYGYTKLEAIRKYIENYGLKGKYIEFIEVNMNDSINIL